MSDYLPQEAILEILYKLPIKSIVRCTSVCKRWLFLIKNPSFISTHLCRNITSSTKDPLLLLRHRHHESYDLSYFSCYMHLHYSLRFDNQEFNHYMHLHCPFKSHGLTRFHIVASCNGLICLCGNPKYLGGNPKSDANIFFILWNPLIGKSLKFPFPVIPHGHYNTFIGFGFDSRSNDYKVVRMVARRYAKEPMPQVDIFSLNANSWKRITEMAPKCKILNVGSQAFVNGVVHWIGFRHMKDINEVSNVVLGLDMGYEVFHEIMLPECLAHVHPMDLNIWVYAESSIAVSMRDYNKCHVWVMKKYGVLRSWTKILILEKQEERLLRVLGFRKNGEVLLEMYPGRIASCDPESQHISDLGILDLGIQGEIWYPIVDTYVESLVLLDKENVKSDANVLSDRGGNIVT